MNRDLRTKIRVTSSKNNNNSEEKIPRKRKYFRKRRPNKEIRGDLRCWVCNQLGHYSNNCPGKKKVLKYVPITRE